MTDRTGSDQDGRPPSLIGTTLRRTIRIGWLYLAIGSFLSLFLATILALEANPAAFASVFPLELPVFAVLGSIGGLMTFTSDRSKGVFEYLISYGVRSRSLFVNGLIAAAAMAAIIMGVGLAVGLGTAVVRGLPLPEDLWKTLGFYTIPMGFAGALFTAMVGMIWSSISTPRAGMNSPVGMAPMVGVGPTVLVLVAAEAAPASDVYYITAGASAAIIVGVVGLLVLSASLMGRERFLSPV